MNSKALRWGEVLESAPAEWPRLRLDKVFQERKERNREDLPLLSVTSGQGVIPQDQLDRRDTSSSDKSKYLRAAPGDLVYNTMRMWQGVSGISAYEGIVSPAYTVCEPMDSHDPGFLGSLCKLPALIGRFHAFSQGIVSDTLNLRFHHLGEIIVPVPPAEEQQKIAAILSSVDDAIAATRKVIEQTQWVKQGLLQTLMTRGIGHTRFNKTVIGEIPEGWEVVRLKDVTIARGSYGANAPKIDFAPDLPRYLRITDINDDGTLKDEGGASIGEDAADGNLVEKDDFLFARTGATVGKTYLVSGKEGRAAFAGYLIRFRTDPSRLAPSFLAAFTHSNRYWAWVEDTARSTAQPNINASEYGLMSLPLPPLDEQREIVALVSRIDRAIMTSKSSIAGLQELKRGLMQDLLTGSVRVPLD